LLLLTIATIGLGQLLDEYEGYGGSSYVEFIIGCTAAAFGFVALFLLVRTRANTAKEAEANEMNRWLLNSLFEGVYAIDTKMRTIFWNRAAERLTGFQAQEMLGRNVHHQLHAGHGEAFPTPEECPVCQALRSDEDGKARHEIFWRKDGSSFPAEYSVKPILQESGSRCLGSVITFRDVTERSKAEELIRKTERLSVAGQLAAGVAHEIRNPLTALKGFSQLLKKHKTEKEAYVDIMLEELDRIQYIVNEFTFLADPHITEYKECDLISIYASAQPIVESYAANVGVRIEAGWDEDVPRLECDEGRIRQLMIHLMNNAIEAMPDGGTITVQIRSHAADGRILFSVKDEGVGISKERLLRLGEPFYTTKEKGTGLGLMVCYKIVEAHSGTLIIDSEQGSGTEVQLFLPVSHRRPGARGR
jgi:PAS domain S-box-containing protein